MNSVQDLKNDIIKTKEVLKQEQENFQERILNGLFDDSDKVLIDNSDYYEKTLKSLENDYKWDDKNTTYIQDEKNEEKTVKKTDNCGKIKKNLKRIFGIS